MLILGRAGRKSRFNDQFDGSFHLILDCHIREFGHAVYMDPILPEISGGQNKGFYSLIDSSRTDRLHFSPLMVSNHAGNGGCTRVG